ncbi:Beta-lactamase class C-like and penicillin binding proteins (PBPs) superfamily [hydrothermal vent metagenome]|uniref:Beta-lactamase class C-like and penicillin binding proteins (PBPs) superfamily n=1 Tax=hydrothermal vent metagenome TaxID=652676 RepID=A0A3B1E1X4_9ZZZZ
MIEDATPEEMGFAPEAWQQMLDLAESFCTTNAIPAIGLQVGRTGKASPTFCFGRQNLGDKNSSLQKDSLFAIASITKPIVATGVMLFVERGLLSLNDRLHDWVPEFKGAGRYNITVRHLLTHTSGLPDMLSNNQQLRESHAPLSQFFEGVCSVPLNFPPGSSTEYSSMGFLLLAELISRLSGKSCSQFLQDEIFKPLGMRETVLGASAEWISSQNRQSRLTEIRLPPEQQETDWHWNSDYWRTTGVPWGGMLSTVTDLGRFAQMIISRGRNGVSQLVSPATIDVMTCNQLEPMRKIPEPERRCRGWGYGWRMQRTDHSATFGDLFSPQVYGHFGATGTLLWIDPTRDLYAIILTTQPLTMQTAHLSRLTNAIVASVIEQ